MMKKGRTQPLVNQRRGKIDTEVSVRCKHRKVSKIASKLDGAAAKLSRRMGKLRAAACVTCVVLGGGVTN